MADFTYGFIGLGLIGGSIARAIKEKLPDSKIIAYDINPDTLIAAKEARVVDEIANTIDSSFHSCNYIFLCAPVQKNDANLSAVQKVISDSCLLTDVGSVKTGIHEAIASAGLNAQFIGGHPMAGSERVGFINSKAILLENAYYILTPTAEVSDRMLSAYKELVQTLGAIPLVLSYTQHDYVTAAVSHLPHIIAASLVNLVKDHDSAEGIMKMIAAGGFKDITRIASSSPIMWQQICLTNTENISGLLADYIAALTAIKKELDAANSPALYDLFDSAQHYRNSFISTSSGPIKSSYSITVDIADEPGALAAIATILALNSISIKNMGIVHNREYEGGVLRIEFYEEQSIELSKSILTNKGYTIHERK